MGPAELRIFNLCSSIITLASTNKTNEIPARVTLELRALLAAQLTPWKAVQTAEDIHALKSLRYSEEQANSMVEAKLKADEEARKRKGSNRYTQPQYNRQQQQSYKAGPSNPKGPKPKK